MTGICPCWRFVLSQQYPLESVCGDAVLLLSWLCVALWVWAAGRGTLRGTEVMHERQAVLPTEIHKLDVPHTWVEVNTWRAWCGEVSRGGQIFKMSKTKINICFLSTYKVIIALLFWHNTDYHKKESVLFFKKAKICQWGKSVNVKILSFNHKSV